MSPPSPPERSTAYRVPRSPRRWHFPRPLIAALLYLGGVAGIWGILLLRTGGNLDIPAVITLGFATLPGNVLLRGIPMTVTVRVVVGAAITAGLLAGAVWLLGRWRRPT